MINNYSRVTNASSGWLTDAQMATDGYESIFSIDFNKKGIID